MCRASHAILEVSTFAIGVRVRWQPSLSSPDRHRPPCSRLLLLRIIIRAHAVQHDFDSLSCAGLARRELFHSRLAHAVGLGSIGPAPGVTQTPLTTPPTGWAVPPSESSSLRISLRMLS